MARRSIPGSQSDLASVCPNYLALLALHTMFESLLMDIGPGITLGGSQVVNLLENRASWHR